MFKAGDAVMYGNSGVCRVTAVREETFGPVRQTYYVLQPVNDGRSVFYCPVSQGDTKLRELLTKAEIVQLIHDMPRANMTWIQDDALRRETYAAMLKSGDRMQIICLIRALHQHRKERQEVGRKLHLADERMMQDAGRLLHEEFAYVLGITPEDVPAYIETELRACGIEL